MNSRVLDVDTLIKIVESQSFTSVFQPIYDLNARKLLGHEALTRTQNNYSDISPLHLFDSAHHCGCIDELEVVTRQKALREFQKYCTQTKLFLNFSPMCLIKHGVDVTHFIEELKQLKISPSDVVIELSEKYPLDDVSGLHRAINEFHHYGFEIAIDDLGAGYAGLKVWSELRPDYVKIDQYFVHGLDTDPVKREFIRSMQNISNSLQCKVIAEGVETIKEFDVIRSIGIHYVQGNFLSRPAYKPVSEIPRILTLDSSCSRRETNLNEHVVELVESTVTLKPDNKLEEAAEIFQQNRLLDSIPVIKNNKPLGILSRSSIMELYFGRYGRELHAKKKVSRYMDKNVLMVESDCILEDVSRMITNNPHSNMEADFIITKNGRYLGVGSTRNLLKKLTDYQIQNARYSNPLTMLPGNVPIYETIDNYLNESRSFYIAYIDVDNFKPYNDFYSYSRGDEILLKTAELLIQNTSSVTEFVGHVGGDDFVVVFQKNNWRDTCEKIIADFNDCLEQFYNKQDYESGGIVSYNRMGDKKTYPFVTLSIGVAKPDLNHCHSHHDIAGLAAEAKRQAKKIKGNSIFLTRRKRPDDAQHLLIQSA